MLEPDPLHASPEAVTTYISALQEADRYLAFELEGDYGPREQSELAVLRLKRASIDAAVGRQVSLAGRRMGTNRQESLATLNALFKLGALPQPLPSGRYRGELVTPTLYPALDAVGRRLGALYMPWKGKRFDLEHSSGDNQFTQSAPFVGRLLWPKYSSYVLQPFGLYTAFQFRTYNGPGVADPEVQTLKLDYSDPANPAFLVRSVLDELVQITDDYFLGKAFLSGPKGQYRLAAFFALRVWR